MTIDVARSARDVERELRTCGTPERAVSEKAYLKSDLRHVGATVGEIRRIVKELTSSHPDMTHDELVELVRLLWSKPIHECRMAAVLLLELSRKALGADDLGLVESMIRGSTTWAYVDGLAANVAGNLVTRFPEIAHRLDSWAIDPVFWVRRSALLALIAASVGGDAPGGGEVPRRDPAGAGHGGRRAAAESWCFKLLHVMYYMRHEATIHAPRAPRSGSG